MEAALGSCEIFVVSKETKTTSDEKFLKKLIANSNKKLTITQIDKKGYSRLPHL